MTFATTPAIKAETYPWTDHENFKIAPMDEVDQALLLDALSASAVALFDAHFDKDSRAGARMLALLKALEVQGTECTSLIYDWASQIPHLERQLAEARKPPDPATSEAYKAAKADLHGALDRMTGAAEKDCQKSREAIERIRAIKDPALRAAAIDAERQRLEFELGEEPSTTEKTKESAATEHADLLKAAEDECLKAREAIEHIRSIKDPALRAAAVRELNSGLSIIMVEEQEHAPIS